MAFTCSITNAGQTLLANTYSANQLITLTSFTIGDGIYTPVGTETAVNGIPQYIGEASSITIGEVVATDTSADNLQAIRISLVIPPTVGGIYYNIGNVIIYATDVNNVVYPFATMAFDQVIVTTGTKYTLTGNFSYVNIGRCFDNTTKSSTFDILSSPFRENQTWVDLSAAVDDVMQANIVEPRNQLLSLRDPNTSDRTMLINTANMLGLNFLSDNFSNDVIDRVVRFIELYYPRSGTIDFINFLSFLKNTHFQLVQLWTNDYVTFLAQSDIPNGSATIFNTLFGAQIVATVSGGTVTALTIKNNGFGGTPGTHALTFVDPIGGSHSVAAAGTYTVGSNGALASVALTANGSGYTATPSVNVNPGVYYPTAHVSIVYDASLFPTQGDVTDISQLFYIIAPAHLVLKYFIATFNANPATLYDCALSFQEEIFSSVSGNPNVVNLYATALTTFIETENPICSTPYVVNLYNSVLSFVQETYTFAAFAYVGSLYYASQIVAFVPGTAIYPSFTYVRDSVGWAYFNNQFIKYEPNNLRYISITDGVGVGGNPQQSQTAILIEQNSQNLLQTPYNPITQSAYLTGGTAYTLSAVGAGNISCAALGVTAAQGAPQTFIPANSGNYSFVPNNVIFAQCEPVSTATSPMLGIAAELVRQADILTFTPNVNDLTVGTIVCTVNKNYPQTLGISPIFSIGDPINSYMIYVNNSTNAIMLRITADGQSIVDVVINTFEPQMVYSANLTVSLSWSGRTVIAAYNGSQTTRAIKVNYSTPTTTNINLGADPSFANFFNGMILSLYYWQDATDATDLAAFNS